ncbi:DNAJ protein JJJ1-like protein [Dichanthelium oligosanthes]|uniref:DNAJ protein JJJ1-like protein n=1 Tax=Dichanthelium oligosanthes TaxID=888268 RepID=A0A1E5UMX6_9POAL|nr:DNAJ protein JJJ1-like protein [Dichanthelium oligosanthes]
MASAAAGAPKRCYYEVLGLARDCSPTDIKLAFRRLALSLHPDKQPPGSDLAAATAAFQELQHAHSVLSDPQERAYYDSHRSQILFSDAASSAAGAKSASPVPDLFAFFSSSAFSGFSDTGRGFYKVYGDVFDRVFAQELAYARRMGVPDPAAPPVIGNLDSPYAQVTAFYNYWLGFGSVMDFGWAAEWDAGRGENRRVRRLMEEDNKKAMRKARREYNDAVRGLAAFCKKRDKRVVDMALKKKAEEEKRKAEEKERKKAEEKRKKERAMAYQEPEWARVEEEEVLYDDDGEEEEEMRAKRKEELYCVACNKKFKSDKQWKNHEQSKKHRDKIAELRMAFKEEEESLKESEEGDWNEVDVGFDFKPMQESDDESAFSDAAEDLAEELEEGLEVHDKENGDKVFNSAEQEVGSYDEASVLEAMLSSRKNRKGGYVAPPEEDLSGAAEDDDDDRSSEVNNAKRKGRRRRAAKKEQDEGTSADNEQCGKSEFQPEESGHGNDVGDKMEGPSSSNDDSASASKGDKQNGKKNKKNKKGTEKKTTVSADQKSTSKADHKSTSKGKKQKVARTVIWHNENVDDID